ncbi:MAG: DNA polymerase III subunit gamma/tau, partial [Bacteroidales bacterium]|nr:DNA polymerase III subunit gamma/tau [Bacteroidales bacterium]
MEQFIVSARKYRPNSFESLIGQENIATTLKNSILRGQLAHAYLFCGPRGVGKTTSARIFAKSINCLNPSEDMEPCGQCESCLSFSEGRSYCIHELDAASNNSVDDIRNLTEMVRIPPQIGKYSVYIIDEVHMLSAAAFNAFLKTLEEPPAYAIFILATTEKHKILPTILSRCQTYDFNRISIPDMVRNLSDIAQKEGVKIEEDALHILAQKADGAMRDALTLFDQTVAFCGKDIKYEQVISNLNILDYEYYFRMIDHFLAADYTSALLIFDEILSKGFNALHFISG